MVVVTFFFFQKLLVQTCELRALRLKKIKLEFISTTISSLRLNEISKY